ncbi:uncharacterized protein [Montipora capricornis]|uniref:uncharacterized protein n=1 Tax=Montipora capricornis TaxID=246305 RepID=UPI0035F12225
MCYLQCVLSLISLNLFVASAKKISPDSVKSVFSALGLGFSFRPSKPLARDLIRSGFEVFKHYCRQEQPSVDYNVAKAASLGYYKTRTWFQGDFMHKLETGAQATIKILYWCGGTPPLWCYTVGK